MTDPLGIELVEFLDIVPPDTDVLWSTYDEDLTWNGKTYRGANKNGTVVLKISPLNPSDPPGNRRGSIEIYVGDEGMRTLFTHDYGFTKCTLDQIVSYDGGVTWEQYGLGGFYILSEGVYAPETKLYTVSLEVSSGDTDQGNRTRLGTTSSPTSLYKYLRKFAGGATLVWPP